MILYNSLGQTKQEFVPFNDKEVNMYTCGPTVYHYAHIGNLRTYIMEDVLEKYLRFSGYNVKRVMNITDVGHLTSDADTGEDKMLKGAKREHKTVLEIAKFYTDAFFADCAKLNIKTPDVVQPATGCIDEFIKVISSLLEKGYDVTIVDNLVNSKALVVDRIENLSGKKVKFFEADVCDEDALRKIFAEDEIFAVIHFAGLKAVGESVQIPLRYYENNLISTLSLLKVMAEFKVNNFVFSSSATVYGNPASVPIREDFPLSTTNPYGTTKLMIERILKDYAHANPDFNPIILRYFNPVGAHKSGTIGEDPNGIPNNLVPYITQVAVGKLRCLGVFGDDYPTKDGTGVRDYIHVVDLAEGHVAALKKFDDPHCGVKIYNLGTGVGYSVLDIVHAFEKCVGHKIPYEIKPRRAGDIPECYADCTKAYEELGWKAQKTLDDMCADSWRWQTQNPNGYNG